MKRRAVGGSLFGKVFVCAAAVLATGLGLTVSLPCSLLSPPVRGNRKLDSTKPLHTRQQHHAAAARTTQTIAFRHEC